MTKQKLQESAWRHASASSKPKTIKSEGNEFVELLTLSSSNLER
jgi:hypothetical protein